MASRRKWSVFLVALSLLPLPAGSCALSLRDALISGALDYVSGTVTEVLTNALPIGPQTESE